MTDSGEDSGEESYPRTSNPQHVEDTFVMLKPDVLERGLFNEALDYFQDSGLKIRAMTKKTMDIDLVREHYGHVSDEHWDDILEYFEDKTVVPMIVTGENAIEEARYIAGNELWPEDNEHGTIRGDLVRPGSTLYASQEEWPNYYEEAHVGDDEPMYNFVHSSDSPEAARKEIQRFFGEEFLELTYSP